MIEVNNDNKKKMTRVDVSVVIPTWERTDMLRSALNKIFACHPLPAEVIVHVDANDAQTIPMLDGAFADRVSYFQSTTTQGPGGGRNLLINKARFPLVASFDDDSWPIDTNYFQTAVDLFQSHPNAAVLSAEEIRPELVSEAERTTDHETACFQNCACLIRRDAFLNTRGYLPLRYAYGMEEADVALQLLDSGWHMIHSPALRVFHNTQLQHHADSSINAAHITNTALLAYLRYPPSAWPLAFVQVINRVRYAISAKRWNGIYRGITTIPYSLWKHRKERQSVRGETIWLSRRISRSA